MLYTSPINLAVKDIAFNYKITATIEKLSSSTIAADYTIDQTKASQPSFSLKGGTYTTDQDLEILSTLAGGVIYYSLDGSDPQKKYEKKIPIHGHGTTVKVKAVAKKDGLRASDSIQETYLVQYPLPSEITVNKSSGSYDSNVSLIISCPTDGADIYYSLNQGPENKYVAPIELMGDLTKSMTYTLTAYSKKNDLSSAIKKFTYTIDYKKAPTPQFMIVNDKKPIKGSLSDSFLIFDSDIQIQFITPINGIDIYYSMDTTGKESTDLDVTKMTKLSQENSIKFPLTGDGQRLKISALSRKNGMKDSEIISKEFSLQYPQLDPVDFDKDTNTIYSTKTVTSSVSLTAPEGSSLYYATDGVNYIKSNTNTATIDLSKTMTISAYATKEGFKNSLILNKKYYVNEKIIIEKESGFYTGDQEVFSIASSMPGLKYVLNFYKMDTLGVVTELSPSTQKTIVLDGNSSSFTLMKNNGGVKLEFPSNSSQPSITFDGTDNLVVKVVTSLTSISDRSSDKTTYYAYNNNPESLWYCSLLYSKSPLGQTIYEGIVSSGELSESVSTIRDFYEKYIPGITKDICPAKITEIKIKQSPIAQNGSVTIPLLKEITSINDFLNDYGSGLYFIKIYGSESNDLSKLTNLKALKLSDENIPAIVLPTSLTNLFYADSLVPFSIKIFGSEGDSVALNYDLSSLVNLKTLSLRDGYGFRKDSPASFILPVSLTCIGLPQISVSSIKVQGGNDNDISALTKLTSLSTTSLPLTLPPQSLDSTYFCD